MALNRNWALVGVTISVFAIFNGFFAITNLIPAFVCFAWFSFIAGTWLYCFTTVISFLSDPCFSGEEKYNLFPVIAIQSAIIFDSCIQWLATTSVLWYDSMGYMCAAWVSTTGRRSDIYYDHFVDIIIATPAWLCELINQLLP